MEPPVSQNVSQNMAHHINLTLQSHFEIPLKAGLYLVATPIGNLGDITIRALSVLAKADVIYCEDTRHSLKLLSHFGIRAPLRAYHDHSAEKERDHILELIENGKSVALISDAGTPLVSDPGFKLVRSVVEKGLRVESLPGASAPVLALTLSGLPSDRFLFVGFLAAKEGARIRQLEELKSVPATLIFFESANRLHESLQAMADIFGPRQAVVARELTKLHEEVLRGSLPELASRIEASPVKGEIVIVVAPPLEVDITDEDILLALKQELAHHSLRDAAKAVAEALNVNKKRVYDLGLRLKVI